MIRASGHDRTLNQPLLALVFGDQDFKRMRAGSKVECDLRGLGIELTLLVIYEANDEQAEARIHAMNANQGAPPPIDMTPPRHGH